MDTIALLIAREQPVILASVIAFTAFFLIARVASARQPVALAFGFTPLLAFWVIGVVIATGALTVSA